MMPRASTLLRSIVTHCKPSNSSLLRVPRIHAYQRQPFLPLLSVTAHTTTPYHYNQYHHSHSTPILPTQQVPNVCVSRQIPELPLQQQPPPARSPPGFTVAQHNIAGHCFHARAIPSMSKKQLPPHFQKLKQLLQAVDARTAATESKIRHIESICAAYLPNALGFTSKPTHEEVPHLAEAIVLSDQVYADIASMRRDTHRVKDEDIIALFEAEGLPKEEATKRAERVVQRFVEDWLSLQDRVKWGKVHQVQEKRLQAWIALPCDAWRLPQMHYLHTQVGNFSCLSDLEEAWARLKLRAEEAIQDAYLGKDKFFPRLTKEVNKEQCRKYVLDSYNEADYNIRMMDKILRRLSLKILRELMTTADYPREAVWISAKSNKNQKEEEYTKIKEDLDQCHQDIEPLLKDGPWSEENCRPNKESHEFRYNSSGTLSNATLLSSGS
ncbi:hypothetical protein M011DRAFT_225810 [Sporormia fimetaria CBS 119925]|uniref:Uncharacterized protein n=1 Tax=Sporormia fimetaria CBS 119925 TaxID=1340428 RepID=A0A6A6V053_9PLEO|nr:hypothetical protein M011DRAFT_225810 [Sporormia fimetaria CBS 119925]